MKLVPVIVVVGVTVAAIAAWKTGLLPEKANQALEQGRAVAEQKINQGREPGQNAAKPAEEPQPAATPKPDCDVSDLDAYQKLGEAYRDGNGVDMDKAHAVKMFTTACEAKSQNGCLALSYMYQTGDGVKQSDEMAVKWLDKACSSGGGLACYHAAGNLRRNDNDRAAKHDPAVLAYYQKGCDLNEAASCYEAAYLINPTTDYTYRASAEGRIYLQKACDLGLAMACQDLKDQQPK